MTNTWISVNAMAGLLAAGRALPLLPEGVPGPVQYDGRWWAIPAGQEDYQPILDEATIARLDAETQRFHQARRDTFPTDEPNEGGPQ